MNEVMAQDHMAWETQGSIADRSEERLGTADRGILMLREMLKREIEKVQKGQDPKGVIRDAAQHTMIDTKLDETLKQMAMSGRLKKSLGARFLINHEDRE